MRRLFPSILAVCLAACASVQEPVTDPALNPALTPLPKPATGEGFQVYMPAFEIPAGSEREVSIYQNSPVTGTQWVKGVQFRMREGSHHFILYTLDGEAENIAQGSIRSDVEFEMKRSTRTFVFGVQTPEATYNFPPGVAVRVEPGEGIDMNAHYVNNSTGLYKGEAYVNLYTTPESEVTHEAIPMLEADISFTIPPNTTYTRKKNWGPFGKRTHLVIFTTHAHKRMKSFRVFKITPAKDTTLLYQSFNWHEPPVLTEEIVFQPTDVLYSETTWHNETSQPIRFGYTSEDEMNVLLGYYWQE